MIVPNWDSSNQRVVLEEIDEPVVVAVQGRLAGYEAQIQGVTA